MAYSRWLTVVDDERGTLQVEFWEGLAFIHSEFRRKVAAMRAAKKLFPQLKQWLREVGHEHSYVCIDPADKVRHRFELAFGFRDLCMYMGFLIMAQRN